MNFIKIIADKGAPYPPRLRGHDRDATIDTTNGETESVYCPGALG